MIHRIRHGLSHALAREVTKHALETYRARFSAFEPNGHWLDPDHAQLSFKALGQRLDGAVRVEPDEIELELDVPFLFRPFQRQAMDVIEEEVRMWIDRAKAGKLD